MAKQQLNQQQTKATARQTGWTYTTNPGGSTSSSVSVTFSTAFAAAPKVIVGLLGYTTGSAPTSTASFTGAYTNQVTCFAVNVTTTGFTVYTTAASAFGASYNGISWIAEA